MPILLSSTNRQGMLVTEKKQEDFFFPTRNLPNITNQTVAIDVTEKNIMAERVEIALLTFSQNHSFYTEKSILVQHIN